jgi:hypothetical protein
MQEGYSKEELKEALRAINSLLSKCEKVRARLSPGTSQHTLLKNRISALCISSAFISRALNEKAKDECL